MNIPSIEGTNPWAKFLTLANAARVRNAGFDLPLTPVRNVSTGKKGVMQSKINPGMRPGSFYKTNRAGNNKVILGKRFDSYA